MTITPAPEKDVNKTTVTYTDEDGNEHTETFTKDPNTNKWVDNNPNDSVSIDPETGVITIPEKAVKDGSEVTAKNTDNSDNTGEKGSDTVKDVTPPSAPEVVAQPDGSVTITPAPEKDVNKTTVTYTDEDGNEHTETFTKDPNTNKWVDNNPNDSVSIDPETGVITIPEKAVKDGSEVTAKNTDNSDNTGEKGSDTVKDVTPPSAPEVVAQPDGSVTITPAPEKDVNKTTVTYTDEDGNEHTETFTKDPNTNKWVDNNPNDSVSIDPETGVITIPEKAVKDGSEVTAKNTDNSDNTGEKGSDTVKDVTPPSAPEVVAQPDGSVTITPAPEKDVNKTTVTYTDEDGNEHTETFTKDPNTNKWVDNNPNDSVSIDPETGVITIPEKSVKDGSEVTAKNTDNSDNTGKESKDTVKDLTPPDAPTVVINDDNDGKINKGDLNQFDKATTTITIPSTAKNGDSLVVTINGSQQTFIVDDNNRSNGITITFDPLANGQNNTVDAYIQRGNLKSAIATDSSITELSNPGLDITVTHVVGVNLSLDYGIKASEYNTHIGQVDLSQDTSVAPRFSSADDSLTVTKNMDGSQNFVDMGDGNNVLNVGGYISGNTQVDFGNGNDKVHISGYLGGSSPINLGAGNDEIIVDGKLQGSARINAGDGDDHISVGSTVISSTAQIDGGNGHDVLTFTDNFKTPTSVGNLHHISGIEEIVLDGTNQTLLGVTYEDLLSNSKSLYITGDSNDTVHLGNQKGNLNDSMNGAGSYQWNATGSVTKGDHTYTEYTFSGDNNYKVYIDTDIQVV
ncbi:hypothetical protein [Haemophilus parainfluenzae]|uniref:hypothetical protein n=1 Tax=Haemophilus parainfluenzae TaxID=729 RepID=UPI000FFE6274|nr:hypothetical protein [Haemophilus parainfluenzae]QAT95232.1 hypothetical protein ERO09_04300 [Haemophilus parainfluenzae]